MSFATRPRRAPRWPPPPPPADAASLSRLVLESARRRGFVAAGILVADEAASWAVFRSWLDRGDHGDMAWLERDAEARRRFDSILPYCRSILSVARRVEGAPGGNVARYAQGEDYHRVVRRELKSVVADVRASCPPGTHFRVAVDTAPILEREVAARCGVGFIGKSGLLIVPGAGSHVVLGELLTDVGLEPTAPLLDPAADRCGSCTACLEACPTSAFLGPRLLDSRRCLSYLTIERRGDLTPDEEASLGGRLFGCDVCQDVCPWNAAPDRADADRRGTPSRIDPAALADMSEIAFQERFGDTAVFRATREGLARNARAALRHESAEETR